MKYVSGINAVRIGPFYTYRLLPLEKQNNISGFLCEKGKYQSKIHLLGDVERVWHPWTVMHRNTSKGALIYTRRESESDLASNLLHCFQTVCFSAVTAAATKIKEKLLFLLLLL